MSNYFSNAEPANLLREYPIGDGFERRFEVMSRDELHALQSRRFLRVLERAWQVPFHARRWRAAGLEPGDVRGLEDIELLPSYGKQDLMDSIEACPPFGDYHGVPGLGSSAAGGTRVVMQTTSGTTGAPQPLFYGARDREVQNILLARAYLAQGLTDDDVVHSVYGFGMVNGGHYIREAVLHYTRALLLPAGTGQETRSAQQVALMARFGASVLVGFGDYMMRLAQVAREHGLQPGVDIPLRLIMGHVDHGLRAQLSQAWGGARVWDWYGVGDTGIVAAEVPGNEGLTLWEDAHHVELLDTDSDQAVGDGGVGRLCVTCLFKDEVYPIIRFDTQDLSRVLPGAGARLSCMRRIEGFLGRADNMVKLRGVNVYPTSIATWLGQVTHCTGEYVCRVRREDGRESMQIDIETTLDLPDADAAGKLRERLRAGLGVDVQVHLVAPGATAPYTQLEQRQKPIRLIDER
ncbi:MAG: phenylacetate--CoA ligase family protein [Gammaproteobacteria bacterium]|nr:phenylacetate--CoA ligase family protein [Gammaproteobacteria bacterium]